MRPDLRVHHLASDASAQRRRVPRRPAARGPTGPPPAPPAAEAPSTAGLIPLQAIWQASPARTESRGLAGVMAGAVVLALVVLCAVIMIAVSTHDSSSPGVLTPQPTTTVAAGAP